MSEVSLLKRVHDAVGGSAAAFRSRVTLQPAGGVGDKVFPPTYSGAVYATEKRQVADRSESGTFKLVECVLLDSVQSQANRIEEALQDAVDEKRISIPVIEVDFSEIPIIEPGQNAEGLFEPIGRVTSLQAPHRVADAILRDSEDQSGVAFRETPAGKKIGFANLRNATPLFEICPTALLLGLWDSTGPKGGLGTKFQRALVSEIVGVDAKRGTKTGSRIDPLAIGADAGPVYRHRNELDWTYDPSEALAEVVKGKPTGKIALYKKKEKTGYTFVDPKSVPKGHDDGKPSTINHSNIPPQLSKPDGDGQPLAGGVTIAYAEQMTVISLPALRRLQFPIDGKVSAEVNKAGRTVLAALGLCGAVLAADRGLDLRSRCLLWPTAPLTWELLDRPGSKSEPFELDAPAAIKLLADAIQQAKDAGLPWMDKPMKLKPAKKLVDLVRKSQELAILSAEAGES